ncbi:unnamed protein product [Durusdinium trenchii]|uniref:Uncharacterized protein n=1 Tax=Durusdinium trenchii TaxID=1381693 RepID=A0ABP0QBT3_9DINO
MSTSLCRFRMRLQVHFLHIRLCGAFRSASQIAPSSIGDEIDPTRLVAVPEERFQELVTAEVAYLATVPVKAVSMRQIVTWRDARDMVSIIQREVPRRFALRIRLIETLDGWQAIPELVKMHQRLTRWYRDLVLLNYSDPDMKEFVGTFKSIREEGKHTIALSASGIYKLRKRLNKFSQQETNFFDDWLDGFLLSRTRMDYNVCRRCMDTFGFYAVVTCLSESRGLLILIPEKSTRLSVLCEITI